MLTWILGYFWSLPRGVSPRLELGHARALSFRAVAAVLSFPSRGSRDLWLSLEAFPRGFPSRLSHEASHSSVPRAISRRGALHRKGQRNSRVVPPFQESARCLCPFQGKLFSLHCLDFQAEDRLTPPWHVGQHCGKPRWKASWESLEGKTHIP